MKFTQGDRVACTQSNLRATVLKVLDNKHVLLLDDDTGMELDYHIRTLVKIETTVEQFRQAPHVKDAPVKTASKNITIDLHYEKLPANYKTQPPLKGRLEYFDYKMAVAIQQGARQVIVIHGRGTGALKSEIVKRLRALKQVKNFTDPEKALGLKDSKLLVNF